MKELRGDESILDIGCGDGKITADLSQFLTIGSIIGIDPSKAMISWANRQYRSINLSFQEGGFLEPNLSGPFDIVLSNCALQHCEDQLEAFKQVYGLLKQHGKLLVSVPSLDNAAWKQARKNIQSMPRWASYWKDVRPRQFLSVEKYVDLLYKAKLIPIGVNPIETQDAFVDREEFLAFLMGTMTPAVPKELAREFFEELIEEYIRLWPEVLREDGVIEARLGRMDIVAIRWDEE